MAEDAYQDSPNVRPSEVFPAVWGVLDSGIPGWVSPGAVNYDPAFSWLGANLKRILTAADESFGISVLTDSTGNDVPGGGNTGDWPYELARLIASAYPAYTVDWNLFLDATQDYAAPVRIQTGTAGERYLRFDGTSYDYSIQNSAIQAAPTTQLDVAVKVALDNWTTLPSMDALICHWGGAGQRSFQFVQGGSGRLQLFTTADGTAQITHTATVSHAFVAGTTNWVRATFLGDNGAGGHDVKFYTSVDGIAWTQLGATITTAGTTSLFAATVPYELGGSSLGSGFLATGNFYRVKIRSTINGPIVAPVMPEHWGPYWPLSTAVPSGAPVLSILAGAVGGQGLTYLSDTTRLLWMLPDYGIRAAFLSTSHNDAGLRDRSWFSSWSTWITNVKAQAYGAAPVIMTENPRFSPAGNIRDHALRRELLIVLGSQLGVPVFDAFQSFLDASTGGHYITVADGVHPRLDIQAGDTYSGAQIWARDVYKALFSGV